jgi:hypothetical protein
MAKSNSIFPKGSYSDEYYRIIARIILDTAFRFSLKNAVLQNTLDRFVKDAGYLLESTDLIALTNIKYDDIGNESVDAVLKEAQPSKVKPVDVLR